MAKGAEQSVTVQTAIVPSSGALVPPGDSSPSPNTYQEEMTRWRLGLP